MISVKTIIANKKQFAKYFITGVSGFILDILSLYFLKEYLHLAAAQSVMINQIFILFYIFLLNKYWSFNSNNGGLAELKRYLVVVFGNYLFSIVWIWFFSDLIGLYYLAVRTVNIALAVSWNFVLYKKWVYREVKNISEEVLKDKVCNEQI
ncbi:hypothetical protein C0584_03660 [Candidatus Parcubacteria bacterium]|nr:MAG: hypothetical protein C0584_03660 [Candidatus Parcubacteria bacterium]